MRVLLQKVLVSVEERAKAIGEENDGVFKLHTQTEITAPKVLGTIDLSSLNQNTRPKKKTKEERRKEREEKNRQGAPGAQANGEKKKRNRIGQERVDLLIHACLPVNKRSSAFASYVSPCRVEVACALT